MTNTEAQAPTTDASVLTRDDWAKIIYDAMSVSLDEKITWEQVQEAAKKQPWQAKSMNFIYDIVDAVTSRLTSTVGAPAPKASVLTADDKLVVDRVDRALLRQGYINTAVDFKQLIDRLTGAPAPAPTIPREPTPAMQSEMMNLDGPMQRGEMHPVDFWKAVYDVAARQGF